MGAARAMALLAFLAVAALPFAGAASAATIVLSQASSDETDPADLDAVFDLSIVGGDTLVVEIENTSVFTINEFFFNGSSAVDGLVLASVSNGTTWASSGPSPAAGFGLFDFSFASDGNANGVQAGDTVTFTFDVLGLCAAALACTMDDFVELSTIPPGDQPALLAAKFVMGEGDDSAFGASIEVPEPLAGLMLGMGLTGLYLSGSRRRA